MKISFHRLVLLQCVIVTRKNTPPTISSLSGRKFFTSLQLPPCVVLHSLRILTAVHYPSHSSAVHCFTAQEGDYVILGSDGVFDNLWITSIVILGSDGVRTEDHAVPPHSYRRAL